jgi:hypothetical protein
VARCKFLPNYKLLWGRRRSLRNDTPTELEVKRDGN